MGVRHLVIAYGAAGISDLVADRLQFGPAWVRELIGAVAEFALRPVEPSLHLPSLSGDILLINSADPDKFIPASSVQELHRLTPEPKTMVKSPFLPFNHVRRFHASFSYQVGSWNKNRRVVPKIEWHPGARGPGIGS